MRKNGLFAKASVIAVLLVGPLGCSEEALPSPFVCQGGNEIHDACAGITTAASSCAAECAQSIEVGDDAALASAMSGAASACVRLKPGSYGPVSVPGGVRLYGASAAEVTVEGVTFQAGSGAATCGLTVGAGGIVVDGATDARIDSVRVSGASTTGIHVATGSSVTIIASEVDESGVHGIRAASAAIVHVESTIISGSKGAAIWAACDGECDCAAPSGPTLSVASSILRDNEYAGIALFGAAGTVNHVDINNTMGGTGTLTGKGGGGLSVAGCSTLNATGLRVRGSESYGVLVDGSSASLGSPDADEGVEISENHVGLWVQGISKVIPQTVTLENGAIDSNEGVGIGVSGETRGFIVCRSAISGTKSVMMPAMEGSVRDIGDGFSWSEESEVAVTDLTLSGNERASMVIDGEALGVLSGVVLAEGDELKGIVQQNFTTGQQPVVKASTPPLTTDKSELFAVPTAPQSLAKNL